MTAILFIPCILLIHVISTRPSNSPVTRELHRIKQLGLLLRAYAEEHDQHFPAQLADIYTSNDDSDALYFHDPVSNKPYDWLYYSNRKRDDPDETIIVASPGVVGNKKRIVLFLDGSASIMPELEFQQKIRHQLHPDDKPDVLVNSITKDFVTKYALPIANYVRSTIRKSGEVSNIKFPKEVTLGELTSNHGVVNTLFKDESRRPPTDGRLITAVNHLANVDLIYPASLDQSEIELHVNVFSQTEDFVAIHIVVPNPLLLTKDHE